MRLLLLYWGMIIIGYVLGSKLRHRREHLSWISRLLLVAIASLVFLMGVRMGANEQVVKNLGTIGLQALFMTLVIMAGSILAVMGTRKLLHMDRFGQLIDSNEVTMDNESIKIILPTQELKDTLPSTTHSKGYSMTLIILGLIAAGMLCGYVLIPKLFISIACFEQMSSTLLILGLSGLLLFVGVDLGLSGSILNNFKNAGFRVLAFPIAVVVGTLFSAYLCSFVLSISAKEALAIGAGFGWYTLAPIVISEQGYEIAGAISFMHNIMREFGGIMLIPIVAGRVGYIEAASMPGVSSMDICIPIIEKFCSERIIIYSFMIGVFQNFLVPILVPLIIRS